MSEAQEMYEYAIQQTGIKDPAEALDSLIAGYGEEYRNENNIEKVYFSGDFEKGDIVRLYSGGPDMTIKEIKEDIIICRWFNKNDELKISEFNCNELVFVKGNQLEENESFVFDNKEEVNNNLNIDDIEDEDIPF